MTLLRNLKNRVDTQPFASRGSSMARQPSHSHHRVLSMPNMLSRVMLGCLAQKSSTHFTKMSCTLGLDKQGCESGTRSPPMRLK